MYGRDSSWICGHHTIARICGPTNLNIVVGVDPLVDIESQNCRPGHAAVDGWHGLDGGGKRDVVTVEPEPHGHVVGGVCKVQQLSTDLDVVDSRVGENKLSVVCWVGGNPVAVVRGVELDQTNRCSRPGALNLRHLRARSVGRLSGSQSASGNSCKT